MSREKEENSIGRSHPKEFSDPRPAIYRQMKLVTDIFRSEHEDFKHLFGIEWSAALFLSSAQFLFPTVYIRHFLGKKWESCWAIGLFKRPSKTKFSYR